MEVSPEQEGEKEDPARAGLDQQLHLAQQHQSLPPQHAPLGGYCPKEQSCQPGWKQWMGPALTSCRFSLWSASSTHFCSRGRSLHMFFKLSCRASKRQMVVWLNTLPGQVG